MKQKKEKKFHLSKTTIQNLSVLDSTEQKNIQAGMLGVTQVPVFCITETS